MDPNNDVKLNSIESYKEEQHIEYVLPKPFKRLMIGERIFYFKETYTGWKQLTKDEESMLRKMNLI